MTARQIALGAALVAAALTFAQDVVPGLDAYHTWQYAAALTLTIVVIVNYAWGARRGADGPTGRRLAIAMLGALTIAVAGLLSGLIGPDTVTVRGTPGSVTPIPDLDAAAFFGVADPSTIAQGDASVALRRRGREPLAIPAGGHVYLGTSILTLALRPAAFIIARDAHDNRLTVTQPTNPTFLSPVLLFPQNQPLRDKLYPFDTFAAPALHRIVHAIYFSAADAQTFNHLGSRQPALVLSVSDDAGRTIGLTIAPSGHAITVGDLQITATLGTYPQIVIAAAPDPLVLAIGVMIFLGGLGAAVVRPNRGAPISLAATEG